MLHFSKQSTVSPSPLGRCCKTSPTSTHPHSLPYYLVALRCLVRSCINICQLCHAFDSHRVPNISWNGLLLHTSFGKLLRCTPKRGLEDDGCPCHACIAFFPQAMILTMNSCLHAQVDLDRLLEAPIAVTKLQIDSQTAIIIKKHCISYTTYYTNKIHTLILPRSTSPQDVYIRNREIPVIVSPKKSMKSKHSREHYIAWQRGIKPHIVSWVWWSISG